MDAATGTIRGDHRLLDGLMFKANVDAAIDVENHIVGLGDVIRASSGKAVAIATSSSRFYDNVAYAEAEAIEWRMQVAKDAHLSCHC